MLCTIDLDAFLPSEYMTMMSAYLEKHHMTDIVALLNEVDNSVSKHYALSISVLDLLWEDQVLGSLLLHHPSTLLPLFDNAVLEVQQRVIKVHEEHLFMTVKPSVHVRLHHLPCCSELCKQTVSSIRADDINCLISVSGTVVRACQIKMLQARREFICTKCKHRFHVEADLEQRHSMTLPPECPSHGLAAKPCSGTKFEPIEGSEDCHDYQEVRIQEQVHRLMVGSIPRSISLLLQNDLVDSAKAGDDVTVVGILRKRWRPLQKDVRCDVEMAIAAQHVRVRNEERGADRVSREAQLEFDEFWREHAHAPLAARNWLIARMCPGLSGMYIVKLAMALTLLGGVGHTDATGMKVRGESHMLLVGDAGTGKSQVLRYAAKLSPRAVITTGIGSTSAGLTCTAVRDAGGEWMLEAGALVLADGGLCCIDEFESIREHDRATIHEAMEQQTLSVAKAGLVCKLSTKCTVFAATNPKGPKYDPSAGLQINTGLPSPLLSRFDVVLLLRDEPDQPRDQALAAHILRHASGLDATPDEWSLDKMRTYLEYAKATYSPEMSAPAERVLVAYFALQRQADQRNAARTTIRLLEAMVRLAQAHARLMYRQSVTLQDAVWSVVMMEVSTQTTPLLGRISVLSTDFPDDPDKEYLMLEATILGQLDLDSDGAKSSQGPAGYGGGGYDHAGGGGGSGGGGGGGFGDGYGFNGEAAVPIHKRQRQFSVDQFSDTSYF